MSPPPSHPGETAPAPLLAALASVWPLVDAIADRFVERVEARLAGKASAGRTIVRAADRQLHGLTRRSFQAAGRRGNFKVFLGGRNEVCAYLDEVLAWVEARTPRRKRPRPALPAAAPPANVNGEDPDLALLRRVGAIGGGRPPRKAAG